METTQYIVLSGDEQTADVERIVRKITLPNPVSISYRHVGGVSDTFIDPLIGTLERSGVKEIHTIFAESFHVDQLRRIALDHGLSVSEL